MSFPLDAGPRDSKPPVPHRPLSRYRFPNDVPMWRLLFELPAVGPLIGLVIGGHIGMWLWKGRGPADIQAQLPWIFLGVVIGFVVVGFLAGYWWINMESFPPIERASIQLAGRWPKARPLISLGIPVLLISTSYFGAPIMMAHPPVAAVYTLLLVTLSVPLIAVGQWLAEPTRFPAVILWWRRTLEEDLHYVLTDQLSAGQCAMWIAVAQRKIWPLWAFSPWASKYEDAYFTIMSEVVGVEKAELREFVIQRASHAERVITGVLLEETLQNWSARGLPTSPIEALLSDGGAMQTDATEDWGGRFNGPLHFREEVLKVMCAMLLDDKKKRDLTQEAVIARLVSEYPPASGMETDDGRQLRRYIETARVTWPTFSWKWLQSEAVRLTQGRLK